MDFKEEERKKVNADTKQKMKEGTEESSLVVEGGEVFGFVDLINNMENSVIAVRLKTLFENGISESMIENKYQELSSGVTNMQTALENMRLVCDMLLKYLSDIPNGIIINMATGEVDIKRSLESAVECGILRPDDISIVDPFKEKFDIVKKESLLKDILRLDVLSDKDKVSLLEEYNAIIRNEILNYSNSPEEEKKVDEGVKEILLEFGESEEEQKKKNEKRDYYKLDTIDDMSLIQTVIFFARKDTFPDMNVVNKKMKCYENSKFYKRLLGEDGKIDYNKVKAFEKEWITEFEETNLREELKRYALLTNRTKVDFEELDVVNKTNIVMALARSVFSEDSSNNKLYKKICENLGIEPTEEELVKLAGVNTLEELRTVAQNHTVNESNYMQKISEMKRYKKMSQSDKLVYETLESVNLQNPLNVETIARLYTTYVEKSRMYDDNTMDSKMYKELSNSIHKYMIYNKEFFSEYMTVLKESGTTAKNKLNYDNVKKVLNNKEHDDEENKKIYRVLPRLEGKIENALESLKGSDQKITQEEFSDFFDKQSEELAITYNKEKRERFNQRNIRVGEIKIQSKRLKQMKQQEQQEEQVEMPDEQQEQIEIPDEQLNDDTTGNSSENTKKKPNKFMTFIGNVAKRVTSLFKKNTVPLLEKGKDDTEEKKDLKDSKDSEKTNTEIKDNKNKLDYIKVNKTPTVQMPQTTEIEGEDKEKPIDVGR